MRTFMLTSPNSKPVDQMDIFERFEKYSLERNPYMQRLYLNKLIKNMTINNESFSEIF
jgi:beta-xylosidase